MTIHAGRRLALSRAPVVGPLACRLWARQDPDVRVFLACVRRGDVVLDVGANRGDYALLFSDLVGEAGEVHAFEPVEESRRAFTAWVGRHRRHRNIRLWPLAVSDRPGSGTMHVPLGDLRQAALTPHRGRSWAGGVIQTHPCATTTLDAWAGANGVERIDFIKCDTEGAEALVLRGATELLTRFQPTLHVEVSLDWTRDFGYQPEHLVALLRSLGYERLVLVEAAFRELGRELRELEDWRAAGSVNLLCLSRRRPAGDRRYRRW